MWRRKWQVCLFAGLAKGLAASKDFKTLKRAKGFVKGTLGRNKQIYCAVIWHKRSSLFYTFYWNGAAVIEWDKPWVLSPRQARSLKVDEDGNVTVNPDSSA